MGIIKVGNLSKVGAVPGDGTYKIQIEKVDAKTSQKGDSTNLFMDWLVLDVIEGEDSTWTGESFRQMVNVQESTVDFWLPLFEAALPETDWRADNDDTEIDPDDLLNCIFIVQGVKGKDNNDKIRFEPKSYFSLKAYEGGSTEVSPDWD